MNRLLEKFYRCGKNGEYSSRIEKVVSRHRKNLNLIIWMIVNRNTIFGYTHYFLIVLINYFFYVYYIYNLLSVCVCMQNIGNCKISICRCLIRTSLRLCIYMQSFSTVYVWASQNTLLLCSCFVYGKYIAQKVLNLLKLVWNVYK